MRGIIKITMSLNERERLALDYALHTLIDKVPENSDIAKAAIGVQNRFAAALAEQAEAPDFDDDEAEHRRQYPV